MSGAAISLMVRAPEQFLAAWTACEKAVASYVGSMGTALLRAQREAAPVGKHMRHPKSKVQTVNREAGAGSIVGSLRILKRSGRGFRRALVVGTTVPQAKWITFGTKPHPIDYRRAKALSIYAPWHGDADEYGWIFRRSVKHPGITKRNNWREKARDFVLTWRSADLWDKAVRKQMAMGGQSSSATAPDVSFVGTE